MTRKTRPAGLEDADFPATAADQPSFIQTWIGFGKHCYARNSALLAHTSTADVARER